MSLVNRITKLATRVACIALLPAAMAATINLSAQAEDLPTLKVASDPSFKPFAYMDTETNKMAGFDIELMQAIGEKAGFKVESVPLDFAGIIPALQSSNVDAGASSITITDARKKVIDFSNPYYDSGLQLLVKENSTSAAIEDLKGKTVGALTGSTGYSFVQKSLGTDVNLVPYPAYATAILSLTSGDTDAVIGDQPVLAYYAATTGKGKAKVVGPVYQGEQFGIAFPKGSKWRDAADKGLAAIKADGTYARIYSKWFGAAPASN